MNVDGLKAMITFDKAMYPEASVDYYVESDKEELNIISTPKNVDLYIATYGNQEIKLCRKTESRDGTLISYYYSVPAFAEKRRLYSEAKAKDCAIWGCE